MGNATEGSCCYNLSLNTMEGFVDEDETNIRPEKRHVQDEIDSTVNCPCKLMTTPRRSRGKTPEGGKTASMTRSDKILDEISVNKTVSSNRTPVEKMDISKTKLSDRTLVEERSISENEPSNRTLLEKKRGKKLRSSNKTPLEEKSTRETRSFHRSLESEKRDIKTRSFSKLPEEDGDTSKTDLMNKSSVQEKHSSKTRLSCRSPAQEERTTRIRFSTITPEPKQDVRKSLSSIRTPLQENITSKTETSDRPLVHCKSGSETKLSENTPLNGRSVKASKAPSSYSLTVKENYSQDTEFREEEFKERGSRTVIRGQNREQHQGDSYPKDAKKNPPADRASSLPHKECVFRKSEDSEVESPVDSLFSDIDKGIQVEVEKVKRRRSTICRGYMSSHSIGGRQSLSATFSLLSLEDQISKIDERLPWASKVSKLVDISIREALRRLEIHLPGNECVADLRVDLLTKFENLAGQIAFKIVDYPKVLEAALPNTSSYAEEVKASTNRIAAYKKMTKELEQEYRNWKVLMKERKLACQTAERKYSEAKSGEKKIEDNQTNQLTSVQRNILSSHPNYHHYIQEIQMVREKAVLMFQEVRLATNAVSCLITSSTLLAESCYASLEELSFGYLKKHPIKTSLTSLLQKSHIGTTKVCEP